MVEFLVLGPLLTLVVLALLIIIALKFGSSIVWLAINSVIGMVILLIVNFLPFINITINIWSILIAVFGGIPGIALLILLDVLGIAF